MTYNDGVDRVKRCGQVTEVYSRVCGYFRPVANFSLGKKEEFKQRKMFDVGLACNTIQNKTAEEQRMNKVTPESISMKLIAV